jgi:glycosyltransferase involved in cell wall biosynthesis
MKISILGTYGIPNHYGGFEKFAEELSVRLVQNGHRVTVYNPSTHPYINKEFRNVTIVTKWLPRILGSAAPLVFDLFCLHHAMKGNAEVIFQCGYTSSVWLPLFRNRKKKRILTHMDGMEWQRGKWGRLAKRLIRWTEKLAVKYSDVIIADHPEIEKYFNQQYGVKCARVGYGVETVAGYGLRVTGLIGGEKASGVRFQASGFGMLNEKEYFLIIARLEPENNVAMLLEGYLESGVKEPIVVVGDDGTSYGRRLKRKFSGRQGIHFTGAIYDKSLLDSLRVYCRAYFHGHSVGGTNPSLLEAMAAGCNIMAHDNPYNHGVLGGHGRYFSSAREVGEFMKDPGMMDNRQEMIQFTLREYSWTRVVEEMEVVMRKT